MAISKDSTTLEANAKKVDEQIATIRENLTALKEMNLLDANEVNTYANLI